MCLKKLDCRKLAVCPMGDGCPCRTKECPEIFSRASGYSLGSVELPKKRS
jgi:hypothetical protein